MFTTKSVLRINNSFYFKQCEKRVGFWDHGGKEPTGLGHLLLYVQDWHFQHQDGTYKFSAAEREQRTLNFSEVSNYPI